MPRRTTARQRKFRRAKKAHEHHLSVSALKSNPLTAFQNQPMITARTSAVCHKIVLIERWLSSGMSRPPCPGDSIFSCLLELADFVALGLVRFLSSLCLVRVGPGSREEDEGSHGAAVGPSGRDETAAIQGSCCCNTSSPLLLSCLQCSFFLSAWSCHWRLISFCRLLSQSGTVSSSVSRVSSECPFHPYEPASGVLPCP
mmetsp:Transcript_64443/g.179253  ORF Transcript_64443/g.179253 Transcript_64443/m.179253 type:complete len:200 (+) Transcript_64443:76-675(+)